MRKICLCLTLVAVGVCIANIARADDAPATQPTGNGYSVTSVWKIGGEGRWDYCIVDSASKRLFVSRQTHTQVIDTDTGKVIGDIPDTKGVHGIAFAPDAGRGFTSNGKGNDVTIFDLKTLAVLGTIATGDNPDSILYDPASKKIFAFDGKSKDVTVIDPAAAPGSAATAHIPLDGKPEFSATDGNGHVYCNIEDQNEVAVIDTQTMKVTDTWKIDGGDGPSGLAIDAAGHHLFSGCGNELMAVIDTQTGKTLATVPIGKGVDACAFDAGTGEAFASCGDGTLTVIKETSPGKFAVTQTAQTHEGARTMALDASTHTIYLASAEFEKAEEGVKHPKMKPDSFVILVVTSQK